MVIGPEHGWSGGDRGAHEVEVQRERLGTAHAALQAVQKFGAGTVAILYADNPLVSAGTMRELA